MQEQIQTQSLKEGLVFLGPLLCGGPFGFMADSGTKIHKKAGLPWLMWLPKRVVHVAGDVQFSSLRASPVLSSQCPIAC